METSSPGCRFCFGRHFSGRTTTMRNFVLRVGAAAALLAGGLLLSPAAPASAGGATRAAADGLSLIDNVQVYYWRGRRYCFYDDGWHGPGWYWCGYAWRRGYGWGGGHGWRGWRHSVRGWRGDRSAWRGG